MCNDFTVDLFLDYSCFVKTKMITPHIQKRNLEIRSYFVSDLVEKLSAHTL